MPRLTLKSLPENVRDIARLAKKNPTEQFATILEQKGWKEVKPECSYSGTHFFTSPCGNFFLKRNFITTKKPSKHTIPTAKLSATEYGYYNWLLQPKADVSKDAQDRAYSMLEGNHSLANVDFRRSNVGFYNGKAVMIDW